MDIHQLRTFATIARTGSIARAAERLALSQPALSGHVKSLEEELGLRLFDRNTKGMVLTQAGRSILRHAEQLLAVRDELLGKRPLTAALFASPPSSSMARSDRA